MQQRRSIKDSLSTKEIEFLNRPLVEAVKPSKSKKVKNSNAKAKPNIERQAGTSISSSNSTREPKPARVAEQWVPLSTRVPKSLHTRLRRMAFDRQERDVQPSTIQDMLVEAVERWLEREARRNEKT